VSGSQGTNDGIQELKNNKKKTRTTRTLKLEVKPGI
jgi:hypothetical protein